MKRITALLAFICFFATSQAQQHDSPSTNGTGGYISSGNYGGTGNAAYFPYGIWANGSYSWIYGNVGFGYGSLYDNEANTPRWKINPSGSSWFNGGNLGIGTNEPGYKLDINIGSVLNNTNIGMNVFGDATGHPGYSGYNLQLNNSSRNISGYLRLARTSSTEYLGMELGSQSRDGVRFMTDADNPTERLRITAGGNVGIGISAPSNRQGWGRVLDVSDASCSKILATANGDAFITGLYAHQSWYGGGGFIGTESNHNLFFITNYNAKMAILTNGNVLIGKTSQTETGIKYKLDVEGPIRAHEIVVNTTGADFVFEPTYKLRSLSELETFIRTNKHLPDIAPAKEMQENGVSAGEMQAKLLQKVEELTLYVIEKDKELKDQKEINSQQQLMLLELKKEIETLKKLTK